uniref:Uncharacterized protein n=1 Tax=Cyprinus carpio TaxID=7962 RepID=A0A8C1SWA5_CYPCA
LNYWDEFCANYFPVSFKGLHSHRQCVLGHDVTIERTERRFRNLQRQLAVLHLLQVPALQHPYIYRCSSYLRYKLTQCLQYYLTDFETLKNYFTFNM